MISYHEVANDPDIKNKYQLIDINNNYYLSHGERHVIDVLMLCKKISVALNIKEEDKNILYIAALLHDIGRVKKDSQNHALDSANYAKDYLKNKLDTESIIKVYEIILSHDIKSLKDDLLESILSFCDRLDFLSNRLEENYASKYNIKTVVEHIKNINFEVIDEKLILTIITDKEITMDDLLEEKPNLKEGLQSEIEHISNFYNYSYEVYLDDECFIKKGRII